MVLDLSDVFSIYCPIKFLLVINERRSAHDRQVYAKNVQSLNVFKIDIKLNPSIFSIIEYFRIGRVSNFNLCTVMIELYIFQIPTLAAVNLRRLGNKASSESDNSLEVLIGHKKIDVV